MLNIHDFSSWLTSHESLLQERVASWIPSELSPEDRSVLLAELKDDCISAIEAAIRIGPKEETPAKNAQDEEPSEDSPEEDEEKPTEAPNSGQLLDRLLYRGVLPRYAFPTDVATFHVFDQASCTPPFRFIASSLLGRRHFGQVIIR